jgi:hypothetical protein
MVVTEIVKSCSHEKIARAAVACIGVDFSRRVSAFAGRRGLDSGVFAAQAVRDFDRRAGRPQREALERAVERADMPVLIGLQLILEAELDQLPM